MHPRIEAHNLDAARLPHEGTIQRRTDAHLVEPVVRAIQAAVLDCSVTAAHVSVGRIYERKGEQGLAPFGHPGYRHSDSDDFYLEVGIRVPRYAAGPVIEAITDVETLTNTQMLREEEAQLEAARARTAEAAAEEARIQALIDRRKTL